MHAAIRAQAARATPKTLARKRSKGYAPRDDEDEDDDVIFVKEIGAHKADLFVSQGISSDRVPPQLP